MPVERTANGRSRPVVSLSGVSFTRHHRQILALVKWEVREGERWVVLGANGSGKSTLLRIATMHEHPTTGTVEVLGEVLGRTDVRRLRRRIGYTSATVASSLRGELIARDIVMTAKNAALEPWWHRYDDNDRARAAACLVRMGVGGLSERSFATLSSGEAQRVLLARTLMTDPGLIVLDEPNAGLDLGGREELVGALADMCADPAAPPLVLVTHHVDEIPPGITHALLLKGGRIQVAGPLDEVITAESLGECFGVALVVERRADGRFSAWAPAGQPAPASAPDPG